MRRLPAAVLFALATATSSAPARAQSAPATTEVELKTPGTVLEATQAWANWHTHWTSEAIVCAAPCTATVPSDGTYRVVGAYGSGIGPTGAFALPGRERVLLDVHPGNRSAHDAGALLGIAGGVTLLAGSLALGSDSGKPLDVGALVATGVGAVLLAVGIPLAIANVTTVDFD